MGKKCFWKAQSYHKAQNGKAVMAQSQQTCHLDKLWKDQQQQQQMNRKIQEMEKEWEIRKSQNYRCQTQGTHWKFKCASQSKAFEESDRQRFSTPPNCSCLQQIYEFSMELLTLFLWMNQRKWVKWRSFLVINLPLVTLGDRLWKTV